MPKPTIPAVPATSAEQGRVLFDKTVKETLEVITGRRGEPVLKLVNTSTSADIINKINELIDLLQ